MANQKKAYVTKNIIRYHPKNLNLLIHIPLKNSIKAAYSTYFSSKSSFNLYLIFYFIRLLLYKSRGGIIKFMLPIEKKSSKADTDIIDSKLSTFFMYLTNCELVNISAEPIVPSPCKPAQKIQILLVF